MQQQIDDIKSTLKELVAAISARNQPLSNEMKAKLAQVMEHAANRIQQLRQEKQETPVDVPIPDNARLLWILSGENEDAFVNYLNTFPDDSLKTLLRNPTQLTQIIESLKASNPKQPTITEDGIPSADINSSNIFGFKYNPKTGKLLVKFQEGGVYGYDGIPPVIYNMFANGAVPAKTHGQNKWGRWWKGKTPSLGATFYELIKNGGYPYQKLS